MGVLSRWFGRRTKGAPSEEAERDAARPAPANRVETADLAAEPPAPPPADPTTGTDAGERPAGADVPQAADLPLRSLQRYRQDPAFKNFMAKAQKRPGAAGRRPGIPSDYLDGGPPRG